MAFYGFEGEHSLLRSKDIFEVEKYEYNLWNFINPFTIHIQKEGSLERKEYNYKVKRKQVYISGEFNLHC